MEGLSLCMIVKNEEDKLQRCLESVKGIVDEIVIVDTGSTDKTKEIASAYNAKVYDYTWNNSFADARNYSLSLSTGNWNLVLDADEYIIGSNINDICTLMSTNEFVGKTCIIDKYYLNNEIHNTKVYLSRLFPKGVFYEGRVHEQIVSDLPRINVELLVGHDGYISDNKVERNLPLLLDEYRNSPSDAYISYQIAKQYYLKKDYISASSFFENALKYSTIRDNFYPMLCVDYLYNCLFLKAFDNGFSFINEVKNKLDWSTDFHFISGLFYMDSIFYDVEKYKNSFPLIEESFVRCLEIGEMENYDTVEGTGSYLAFYNLAVYNEVLGNKEAALFLYEEAAKLGYHKAKNRMIMIKGNC